MNDFLQTRVEVGVVADSAEVGLQALAELRECPEVSLLVTSREKLDLAGEVASLFVDQAVAEALQAPPP